MKTGEHCISVQQWIGMDLLLGMYVVTFKAILLEMLSYLPKVVISSFWILKGMLLGPVFLDSHVFYDTHTCLNFCLDFEVLSWRRSYE